MSTSIAVLADDEADARQKREVWEKKQQTKGNGLRVKRVGEPLPIKFGVGFVFVVEIEHIN